MGRGVFPPANDSAGEVKSTVEQSDQMPSRPEKGTDVDITQRKGNIAL